MIENFFNHKCDIYHLKENPVDVGFGFDTQDIKYEYESSPSIANLSCHFHSKSLSNTIQQTEPMNNLSIVRKLSLPIGTDVRVNDKVVDCNTGLEYTAQLPVPIQNHHITVVLTRTSKQVIL